MVIFTIRRWKKGEGEATLTKISLEVATSSFSQNTFVGWSRGFVGSGRACWVGKKLGVAGFF